MVVPIIWLYAPHATMCLPIVKHKQQITRLDPFFLTITAASPPHYQVTVVAWVQGQPLLGKGGCMWGGVFCFWYLPFPSFSLLKLVGTMSKADSGLCWGCMMKKVNKVKHIFTVGMREGQVQNEGIKEEWEVKCVGIWIERERVVWVFVYVHEYCIPD